MTAACSSSLPPPLSCFQREDERLESWPRANLIYLLQYIKCCLARGRAVDLINSSTLFWLQAQYELYRPHLVSLSPSQSMPPPNQRSRASTPISSTLASGLLVVPLSPLLFPSFRSLNIYPGGSGHDTANWTYYRLTSADGALFFRTCLHTVYMCRV